MLVIGLAKFVLEFGLLLAGAIIRVLGAGIGGLGLRGGLTSFFFCFVPVGQCPFPVLHFAAFPKHPVIGGIVGIEFLHERDGYVFLSAKGH